MDTNKRSNLIFAVLVPIAALGVQWILWPYITPLVWFLFFPAVFFSARLGGLKGGLLSTFLSAALVWYFFIPPRLSWAVDNPYSLYSVGLFVIMGYLFSDAHERLEAANRRASEALKEGEARYQYLFGNMLNGFAYCQMLYRDGKPDDFIYLNVNKAFGELTGLKDVVGKRVTEVIPGVKEATPEIFEIYAGVAETGVPKQFELDFTPLNIWLDISVYSPQKGYFVAVFENITERKRAEQALQDSQAQLQGIINSALDAIISIDEDQRIVLFNPAAEHMFKCRAGDAIGGRLERFMPEDVRADHEEFVRAFGRSNSTKRSMKNSSLALTCLRADGEAFPGEISISQLDVGGRKLYTAIVRDITEKKTAEDALRESEVKYRSLFENVPDGIYRTTPGGEILAVNPAFVRLLGYESEQKLMQSIRAQEMYPNPADRLGFVRALEEHGEIRNTEIALRRRDGTQLVFLENARAIRNEKGETLYYEGVLTDITERKRAEEKIVRQLHRLSALKEIDRAIASSLNLKFNLQMLVNHVAMELGADASAVLMLHSSLGMLEYAAGHGFYGSGSKRTMPLGENYAGRAALERRTIHVPDLSLAGYSIAKPSHIDGEGFVAYWAIPLIAKGKVKGVLEVFHRSRLETDAEWLEYLETLAGQAAIAIDHLELFENLEYRNFELTSAYDATIEGWSRALDLRDKETEGHTQRVTEMTVRLAASMGIKEAEIVHIRRGALLHDMGKLGVQDQILFKRESLTEEEWALMRRHPQFAYDMLFPIEFLRSALDIPYCHHEKWDGTGYPQGLKGEQIPLAARIFAVVDVWDALTSDRPYRKAWLKKMARQHIKEQSGKHFDPHVVEMFLKEFGSE